MHLASEHIQSSAPLLGCIADDFTGATDLASFLVASGMRTVQINDLSDAQLLQQLPPCDALVIALKTRSIPPVDAVRDSLNALTFLQTLGCQQFFFKYCSTFDSTAQGNIGPVTDALLAALGETSTIVCPALPVNGRTVYQGYLFVFNQLLHESPMRNHPVTPMHDSSLLRLIEAQGKGKAVNIPFNIVDRGEAALVDALAQARKNFNYLVVDALTHEHLVTLGHACANFKLITGGSGLATDLCHSFVAQDFVPQSPNKLLETLQGSALVISGSCSAMTQHQVAHYQVHNPSFKIDPLRLHSGAQTLDEIMNWIKQQLPDGVPLIYATADADAVRLVQDELGREASQQLLENTLAEIAARSLDLGVKHLVVAGGETSGAIVKRLQLNAFQIGPSITPGVPKVQTLATNKINLALKSGNFGQADFFSKAVEALRC